MERSPEQFGRRRSDGGHPQRSEAGLETIEYALIAALVLTALLASIPLIAEEVFPAYNAIINAINDGLGG